MSKRQKKLSRLAKAAIIFTCIVAVVIGGLLIYFFGNNLSEFYNVSKNDFAIPGLDDHFVPQGICYIDSSGDYLVSGYMSDNSSSRIYIVNPEDDTTEKWFTLANTTKAMRLGHLGGIACKNNFVWIASEKYLLTLPLTSVLKVRSGGAVPVLHSMLAAETSADFCFANAEGLYIGEFYNKGDFETDISHHIEIEGQVANPSIVVFFPFSSSTTNGLAEVPTKALSIPEKVQGMAITASGRIVLSTSYALPNSKIYIYEDVFNLETATIKSINLASGTLPLYVLTNKELIKTLVAPCMSEGIDYVDGQIKILFESACQKYRLYTRNQIEYVQSIKID